MESFSNKPAKCLETRSCIKVIVKPVLVFVSTFVTRDLLQTSDNAVTEKDSCEESPGMIPSLHFNTFHTIFTPRRIAEKKQGC